MKRKDAIEYLDRLGDELNDISASATVEGILAAGMTFGVEHARLVLNDDIGAGKPTEDAYGMVEDGMTILGSFMGGDRQ